MRMLERSLWGNCASASIDEGAHAIGIVGVPGYQHVEIVRQTDQPPVEHPTTGHARRFTTVMSAGLPKAFGPISSMLWPARAVPGPGAYR